ncbi:CRM-domain containing factor CFM3, chloroplastic/mitochondrial [Benincasa hispida]|uniref:CRM-domain containing factor CFM3, chloroplastic/mitochondrial n=1 Tax=Benincasa hispida TaxID=102211 RepID=UPI00190194BB|nr:CRM-domain containing factor CFM3, chloroplastic/mitochondrial [Benincasa hispida]XP_038894220.1 CRM-domain containing factor CFM3, chloroplastic/mitochondrial [Benincasa hispida]
MAFATVKLSELPLKNSFPLSSHSRTLLSNPNLSLQILNTFSSLRTPTEHSGKRTPKTSHNSGPPSSSSSSSSWISKWPSGSSRNDRKVEKKVLQPTRDDRTDRAENQTQYFDKDKGQSAIERIVLRLRNLGIGSDDEDDDEEDNGLDSLEAMPVTGEEKLGDLLQREWIRPDGALDSNEDGDDEMVLPWEREEERDEEEEGGRGLKRRKMKAPTLAELTIEDEELRRLRRMGMFLRERINVPKAGITQAVLEKIHGKWRKEELVRLKFHEELAHDMKTAHEIVERRTGGLVLWRSGSVMVVYRGSNYEGPSKTKPLTSEGDGVFIPDVSSAATSTMSDNVAASAPEKTKMPIGPPKSNEGLSEEEAEYNQLLDGLGPRFVEWWGTGVLPIDADQLPPSIPGYKTPFRLLPTGMRSRLTNAEMTQMRKLAKSLPCHFALGRNRNHQGLAVAILKLWEKSLVVKIAVKRGIQNTNNKLMAEEIRNLTGGVLLLRNKYFIVIYRGKDFLPPSVAVALVERQELTKQIQDVEEKARSRVVQATSSSIDGQAPAGTLAEFYEAQSRWGREITAEEREKMVEESSRAKTARLVRRIEHKLGVAQAKKLRAERLLSKIEASMVLSGPDDDQETITDEERVMFRRVGLGMTAYLPIGIRGVFDGVVENMHLHWKHRELVKLVSKQTTLAFVEETARLLEYESGGILVSIDRVPKGYALIYYRGKNYRRPIALRPRNLLTKAKALKRSVAMQRHEALSQHISELEKNIAQMKKEIGVTEDSDDENKWSSQDGSVSGSFQDEEASLSAFSDGDNDEDGIDEDSEYQEDSDYDFSDSESTDDLLN